MKHIYGLGMLLFAMSVVSPLPARASDAPEVIISEINWAGSARSTSDEWIELWNRGGIDVDVGGWFLTGVGTSGSAIMLADGTTMLAGSTLLIANYAKGEEKTSLDTDPGLMTTAVSVPNTSLNIVLAAKDGLVVDELHDPGDPDFGAKDVFASMERDPDTLEWRTASSSIGMLDRQLGSPGSINASLAPPTEDPIVEQTEPEVITETPPTEVITEVTPTEEAPAETEPQIEEVSVIEEPIIEEPEPTPTPEAPIEMIPIIEEVEPDPKPISEPISEPTPEPTPVYTPEMIRFSEILSRPSSGNEWIELANMHGESIDLTGWTVVDASGKSTELVGSLEPGGYILLENPKGKLNNDGDMLTLFAPNGQLIAAVEYGTPDVKAPDVDESLIWLEGEWKLTLLATPNYANILSAPKIDSAPTTYGDTPAAAAKKPTAPTQRTDSAPSDGTAPPHGAPTETTEPADDLVAYVATPVSVKTASTSKASSTTSTKKASSSSSKKTATTTVTGSIVALPGVFGKQIMYINSKEIYFNAAEWPAMQLNDLVEISGTESASDGNERIKISNASNIRFIGTQAAEPLLYSDTLAHGTLATVSGTIVAKTANGFTVETTDGTRVDIAIDRDSGIRASDIVAGDVTLVGIVRKKDGIAALYPRTVDDLTFAATATISTPPSSSTPSTPWLGLALLLGSGGTLGTWYMRSRLTQNALTLQTS